MNKAQKDKVLTLFRQYMKDIQNAIDNENRKKEEQFRKRQIKAQTKVQSTLVEIANRYRGSEITEEFNTWEEILSYANRIRSRKDDPFWTRYIPDEMLAAWKIMPDEGKVMVLIVGLFWDGEEWANA